MSLHLFFVPIRSIPSSKLGLPPQLTRKSDERQMQRVEKLKGEVKAMIGDTNVNSLTILELINDIQRLGLSHHFQKDITRALDIILLSVINGTNLRADQPISVHATALCFRLCRQHGYEASQGRKPYGRGQSIHKQTSEGHKGKIVDKDLVEQIDHALEMPLHHRVLRLEVEARWYVEAYGKRKDANHLLLEMAKLDLNMVQSLLQGELKDMSRWDIKAVETLPAGLHEVVDLCKAFLAEAKWCFEKATPTFKAYLENAVVSASGMLISVHAYFLLTETITKEALECLEKKESYHPLMECPSLIFRLYNDLATSKAESERGESANSIMCCMHKTGLSEEEARKHIRKLIDEAWKKMSKERVAVDSPFEKPFIETTINVARMSECTYQNGDRHGAPDNQAKNRVLSVIIEPIPSC
ncbi:hypothetical protein RHGRI_010019 [Rhododendron griersonianum]|uniref:Uncharacterized protein n=1 Tax=Rhododendron griersonianum TaxID=479676 RepID=A0AAV6KH08_9ERIC|nr:hypothetical protein RHGRI_010019 [Rhododendron griersonianum]